MASVTFSPSVGGDGSTVTDDSDASTGLGNGGHRTRFVPALVQLVAVASFVAPKVADAVAAAVAAAASAATAINAPGTNGTSTSSVIVGTGSKTLTVQTGKNFVAGQPVMVARTSAPSATWMAGNITAYNSGSGVLTVDAVWVNGSGTFTDWTVSLAGPANPNAVSKMGDTMTGPLVVPTVVYREDVQKISANTTAVRGKTYVFTASCVLDMPASPTAGDWVDCKNSSGVTTCTIGRNGQPIEGLAQNMTISALNIPFRMLYVDATFGWVIK